MTKTEIMLEILLKHIHQAPVEMVLASHIKDIEKNIEFPKAPKDGEIFSIENGKHTWMYYTGKWEYQYIH